MKSVLTSGGFLTFVSLREWEFLEEQFRDRTKVSKKSLDEHQAETARILASRGVLDRRRDDNHGVYYVKNQNKGIE
jgi:hypothetical protein